MFIPAPLPANEPERLARLRELLVLDSAAEPAFDAITRLAAEVCGTSLALITLVDEHRQWFKSKAGGTGLSETPRDIAFCSHTILSDELMVVSDASRDPRFADNPFVTDLPHIRFYAGAPLILPQGERVGTLCVFADHPRQLNAHQAHVLKSLAEVVSQTLVMRAELIVGALRVRTEYEKRLAQAFEELADLYDHAPCGYHSLDPSGRFLRINNAALEWLGHTRDEVIGRHVTEFLAPAGVASFQQNFPRLLREGRLDNVEFEFVGRSGVPRRVIANATAIRGADGAAVATRTITYDVSELQRTREALRQLSTEQQAVLDTDLLAIMKVRDRHVVWANRGAERLFGYAHGELLGVSNRALYAEEADYERSGEVAYREMREGKVFAMQVQARRKDGERIWVDVRGTTSPDSPEDVLSMVLDISAFKRAAEAEAQAQALAAENRHLAEVSRVKGTFLSNMSHELRTPLNAVIGYAHLLQAGTVAPDSPKFKHYLGQIGGSGRQLLGLIDSVLDFAAAESGVLDLRPAALRLKTLLMEAVEAQRTASLKQGIFITVDADADLGDVWADEARLGQALGHYLANAIKFSPNGSTVTVRGLAEGAAHLRIEVEDMGIGFAPEDLPRLFAPFRQLSEGSTKAFPGAGLGLALTRRLVEAQGGTVGAHSVPGEGSTFWMVLPRAPKTSPD